MPSESESGRPSDAAALVALVRAGRRPPARYAELIEGGRAATEVLDEEQGLLAHELASAAAEDLRRWQDKGVKLVTVLEGGYPENLRAVHDRPPFIFVSGDLKEADERAVAVIGSRQASAAGLRRARVVCEGLVDSGYTIVSGLAAGIDTAAHLTALERGARTVAVIGTGLNRCYPPQNASLQRRIASEGAVVSQFWPDESPRRDTFPLRNALMSGLSLATLIVEASERSGARIQARHALGHGRPVLLYASLLDQPWAEDLSGRAGTHIVRSPPEVVEVVERISSFEAPTV